MSITRLSMPYVRDELERMLQLSPSTATGLTSYSKILGDRYSPRAIFSLIRKIVLNDVKSGVLPNLGWRLETVKTESGSSTQMYVYHLLPDPWRLEQNDMLEQNLKSLKMRSYRGSDTYNSLNDIILELGYIRRSYK